LKIFIDAAKERKTFAALWIESNPSANQTNARENLKRLDDCHQK
jgi:hypothetical protein